MVSTKTASQSKRKKTEDMPDSPPKRVTRARAKATEDTGPKSKVTKITTASAKASAEKKRLTEPAKPIKRKTRTDDDVEEPVANAIPDGEVKAPVKARGRQKKVNDDAKEVPPSVDVPAPTRGRQSKAVASDQISSEAPKLRGRPKKAAIVKAETPSEAVNVEISNSTNEKVGGRAIRPTKTAQEPASKVNTVRKRVKFHDEPEQGKENVPLKLKTLEKSIGKATGLKAKPIRKPATVRATTRGKKTPQKKAEDEIEAAEVRPLSPKKVKQVAKSSSIGSEDELGNERTPIRELSKSPVRSPARDQKKDAPVLDFGEMKALSSSIKGASSVLASPARKPPPSPFKDALKDSPRRVHLGDTIAIPILNRSPAKSSMLQSPARRPPVSPIKLRAVGIPGKSVTATPIADTATTSKHAKPIRTPFFSPSKTISSPLRAARSPEQPFKVHKIDKSEQAATGSHNRKSPIIPNNQEDKSRLDSSTPKTLENPIEDAQNEGNQSPSPFESTQCTTASLNETDVQNQYEESSMEDQGNQSTTPPDFPDPIVAPAFSFAFPRLTPAHEDSDSEDELASGRKSYIPSKVGKHLVSSERHDISVSSEDVDWTPIPNGNVKAYSMTPLATQLSSWLASSPEKQTAAPFERKRGIFSPVGPTLLNRPVQVMDFPVVGTPPRSSFFEDQMVAHEGGVQVFSPDVADGQEIYDVVEFSQESQASEEYGDENAMPVDPQLVTDQPESNEAAVTCTPSKVFFNQPREIHTVSKVPLRPADDDSPLRVPRQRSRSLAGPLRSVSTTKASTLHRLSNVPSEFHDLNELNGIQPIDFTNQSHVTPIKLGSEVLQTPRTSSLSSFGTPIRTDRKGAAANVLEGAVVFVDVYTTEGADASGIFLDLLGQMGARCVKQWNWNPRSGNSLGDDAATTSPDSALPGNKVGITHVVYKDGGKRTLEKVREAKGVVLCVGVGWVLE